MDIPFLLNVDVLVIICEHLDAFSLVRMGMSSKTAWSAVNKKAIMEAAALRTFPNIFDLPRDKGSHFYLRIFAGYFNPPVYPLHHLEISSIIYDRLKYNPNAEEPSLSTARITARIICRNLFSEGWSAAGRKNVINCVIEWMNMIRNNRVSRLDLCDDALAILATTKAFLQKRFIFNAMTADREFGYVSCY
jgi:hypothetical protein